MLHPWMETPQAYAVSCVLQQQFSLLEDRIPHSCVYSCCVHALRATGTVSI